MIVIGLTGSIASGKSTACKLLREFDQKMPIYDADQLSYEATQKGNLPYLILRYLVLPRDCFDTSDGSLIRLRLAELIFAQNEKSRQLKKIVERCIHPWVIFRMLIGIFWCWISGHSRVVLDIPLLFEVNLTWMCTTTVLIDIPNSKVQLERLLKRNSSLSESEAKNRIAAQFSLERKRALAKHIILNDGDVSVLKRRLLKLFKSPALNPNKLFHFTLYLCLPLCIMLCTSIWAWRLSGTPATTKS